MRDLKLSPEEKRDIEVGDKMGFSGLYCQQCGQCMPQCPSNMDIPILMRGYMYAFGHQELKKARETLRSWTSAEVMCLNCEKCEVECSLGFDVKSRALDVARILGGSEESMV
jgi:predicted aldo/keto reductase-like oxidoreductase